MNARTFALLTGCFFSAAPLFAEGPQQTSPAELRLREQLKSTMLQLRNAETERATLQAAQTERDQKIKKLEEQVAALTRQATDDKEAADKAAAKLAEEIAAKRADIARLNDLLVKSEDTGKKNAALLKKTEDQRAKLAAEAIQFQRTVTEQRAKNAKMYEAAEEVLSRYEKFSLGTAITAREPFAGITRAPAKLRGRIRREALRWPHPGRWHLAESRACGSEKAADTLRDEMSAVKDVDARWTPQRTARGTLAIRTM